MADDATPDTVITVPKSAAPGQLAQAARTLLTALGGVAIGRGWLSADVVSALVTVIMIGGPLAWGQIRTFQTHTERVTMANKLPDDEAKVVGKPAS